jgi:hemerythrin superfamily protein
MKATNLLRNDHEALKSLFAKLTNANGNQNGKKELLGLIHREILMHSQMETEIFYPALEATSSPTAQELVSSALNEHEAVEKLLQELSDMSAQDRNFETKVSHLIDEVNRHIEKEEEQIFDEARTNLSEHRLEELGIEMEDRRKMLTQLAA